MVKGILVKNIRCIHFVFVHNVLWIRSSENTFGHFFLNCCVLLQFHLRLYIRAIVISAYSYNFVEEDFMTLIFEDFFYGERYKISMVRTQISIIIFTRNMDNEFCTLWILTCSKSINLEQINFPVNFYNIQRYYNQLSYKKCSILLCFDKLNRCIFVINRSLSCLKPYLLYFESEHDK